MIRTNRIRIHLYSWVKLLLAAVVTMGVATTGVALATAGPAGATTPAIASTNANYSLTGTPMPKTFTGTAPTNQPDSTLSAAVTNPSTATTLSFTSVSTTYVFAPIGQVDVYSACSVTGTGSQLPSYIFSYTGNPFTVSGTSVSGGTGVTGASLVYTNPSCSSTTAIPSGSEVYQTGAPAVTYALANVSGGAGNVNTASLQITSQPSISNGYATVDPTTGQIYMQPQPTASGNFTLTYAYCVPGVTLTSDPSGLSDGNCSTATVTYLDAIHCELVGELVTVSISSSTIYQSICSSTVAPATVNPGQTFTYDTVPGTSVIPVEESTSVGNATIQYGGNFTSIVPVPNGVSYVPGTARAVGGDPTTRGQATVKYCTSAITGCDATLSGNYKTTYPYIELELPSAIHINGGSMVTLPYVEAQFKATGTPGTQIGTALSEFRLNTQVNIPIIGSNTAAFDGYPTSCNGQNSSSVGCPTSGTPAYVAPTVYPFTQIVPGVTGVSTPGGSPGGTDAGGSTVTLSGSGFTGATAVTFGSTPAASYTVNSDSSITAVAPPSGTDGTVDITVTTGGATSSTSSADYFTYVPSSVPDTPSGLQVTPGDGTAADGAATVSWSPTFGEGSAVTGYSVSATDNTTPANPVQTCSSTDPTDSCSLSGLQTGDSYTFAVTATNGIGTGAAGTVTVTEGAPSAPTGVSATAGRESAAVSFSPPATSGDGSAVSSYTVTAVDTTTPANGGQTASGASSPVTVSGLTDADSYTFTVTATNASGASQSSSASSAVTPKGVPGAPTGVSGTNNANASSVVSFTAPTATNGSAVTAFTVTAADSTTPANGGQTCSYTIPTPAPDTTTYSCTVSGLTNGDSYSFTATATNAIGTGAASAASSPIVPATTPGAPTGVTAHANPDGTVQVSWTAPASNGGAAISSYTATSSSGSKTCTTANGTTLTCAVSGTTIGTSYTYTVKATNGNGTSAASAASASVVTTSLPAAPTAVSGTGSSGQVSVTFTGDTTTATEGGTAITGYTVTATDVTNPSNGGQTATGTTSPIVVTGLTNLDEYTFTVHATNAVGNSPESAASAQVAPGGVPSVPLNVTAVNVSPGGNAQVSWTPPASPGGTISQYVVTSSTGSKTCTYTGPFGAGETDTCAVTGLTIGTSYTYTVKATNQSGTSASSAASNAVVSSTTPNAPTSPSATTGNASATVSFTGDTTTATEGGIAITGYTVTATDTTNGANGGQTSTALTSPITVSGLTNGDTYTFTVHATNANGNSAESTATAAVNPGRPSAPTSVVAGADASSQTTLDVSWAASTSPDGTSPITGYTVTSSPGSFTCTTSGATTCNVSGLTAKTAYTFTVTATNQFGTGPASSASTAQNAGYPGIPTNVVATQAAGGGAGTITVTWTVPNNGGSALTTETATSSSGSKTCTDTTHLTAGQTATCNMTGLTVGTAYTVTVKGTNANGTGSSSAASNSITPATTPSAPTAVTAATGNGQETVSWTAGSAQGGTISGYTVTSTPGSFTCTSATTSCTVTGLTNGTSYTFTVTETTQYATSAASAASTALAAGVPNPPTGVVATADASSATTLDVSWTAATSPDGTSPITGYTVTSSPGSFTCTTSGATTCNVSGLTAKTAYTFTVKATNQYGTGLASAASASLNAGYPGIPSGVSAVLTQNTANGTTGSATVSWTVPVNGGAALTTETATSSSGSKTCTDTTHLTAGQTATCTVTALTTGTAYTFTVKSTNANGSSAASSASNSVTIETLPLAPTAAAATAGNHSATVSFTAPATTNSGAISSYTVTATDTTTPANGGQTASGASSPITVTGLTNGDAYTFTVRATAVDGTGAASAASSAVTPAAAPDAPTGVAATPGNQSAQVSFTAPFNEGSTITGYTVTATDTTTAGNGGQTASGASSPITVSGLTNGDSYTFTVTATNANGTGAASAASAAVTPSTVPDAPSGVTATAGISSATVSWSPPDTDGGSVITGYTVSDGSGDTCTTPDGSTTTCTVTGLTAGTAYTFTVTASNADGASSASTPSSSVTPYAVPGAPTSVTGTPGNQAITVSWTAPNANGSAITGYTVSDGSGDTCTTPDGSTTSCTVTGLTNGTAYTFTVTATNLAGTGAASSASAPVVPVTVPDAPTSVSATAGNASATVSWTASNDEGSPVTGYTVSDGSGDTCTTDGSSTSCTVTGLSNGTAYTFTVTATSADGTGLASAPSNSVTPNTVPDAPSGVAAVAGSSSATVSWTAPFDEGSAITGYTVSDGSGDTCTTDGSSTSCTVSGLTPQAPYTFTVTASNADGTGAASAASNSVLPTTVPDAPTGVSAAAGPSSATVSWTAPFDEGSAITGYTVSDGSGDTCTTDGSSTSCTVSGLTNGTAYTFTVTATNSDGTGAASAASSSVTPSAAPDAPTGVSAAAGNGSATVSWTAPNNEGSTITGYTVTSSGGQTCSTSSTSCIVSGLANGTAYTFTVTATNGTGTGAASAASSAVTPSSAPDAPTAVTGAPSNQSVQVSWTAPFDEGSAITGYAVTDGAGHTCSTDGSTTSCVVSGLSNGTAYSFTVTATNADGTSSASTPSTPVTPSTVPGAPTGVTATAGNGQATVSWTAPFNEGLPISSYSVLSSTGKTCTTASTTCTVTGLTNGVAVTFTVRATNGNGTGAASASSNPVTPSSNTSAFTSASSVTIATGKALALAVTTSGTPKAAVSVTGLPSWMVFTPGTGAKLGTAKVNGVGPAGGGQYTFTLHVNNGVGPDTTQVVTVHVLAITTSGAVAFHKGVAGSVTITTTGGASGVVLAATVPTALAGLTFHDNGNGTATLSGTPGAKDRSATVTITATAGTATTTLHLAVGIS